MWQPLMHSRKSIRSRRGLSRQSNRYRPLCKSLEDRCLLSVTLTPSGPPVPLVGAPVVWTATASGDGSSPVYQFSAGPVGGALQMVQDFSSSNSFTWNPLQQGTYDIQVIVKDSYSATATDPGSTTYTAESRVAGNTAVISPMSNPLIALYSAPPSTDTSMYVQFAQLGPNLSWQSTAPLPIVSGESTNFIVAGLLPDTTYLMRHVLNDGTASAPLPFTTGNLPSNLPFPTVTGPQPAAPTSDLTQNMVFHMGIGVPNGTVDTFATDLNGNINWYFDPVANNFPSYATTVLPGGDVFLLGGNEQAGGLADTLREIDLAGDTLRETNVNALNAELAALGDFPIQNLNHDAILLPNGDTAVIANSQRVVDVNGTPTTYVGNMVLVLNQNFQINWVWDAFDWLSTSRLPTLGEGPGDWLHANSLSWSPEDGDLLVSLRAQDWVIKIDYDDGSGDGHVVWRLGPEGDFTIVSNDPSPWFTHQHNAMYINNTTIVLFDDGNVRRATNPNADSRGQELVLNEQTMTATLVVNADLGNYSSALGSAQLLPNGDLDFTSGFQDQNTSPLGQTIEVEPNGTQTFVQQIASDEYRSYLMSNLYGSVADIYDPGFEYPIEGSGSTAYQYDPTSSSWSFSGTAGLAGNGSALTSGNANAPQGNQVAFIQQTGSISQAVELFPADGTYQISVAAAQSAANGGNLEEIEVEVDGTVVSVLTPSTTGYGTSMTAPFSVTAGSHTITFVGVNPSGGTNTAFLDHVNIQSVAPKQTYAAGYVNLSAAFNRAGIEVDGTQFSGVGLDGGGYALSANLVGTTLTHSGTTFDFGRAGENDVVSAQGQTIALPQSNDAALELLATGVNGGQPNQTFTVTYTDGTTSTFSQSISDWTIRQGYLGEATALSTSYRDVSNGTSQSGHFDIYEYAFDLNPGKTVLSITLPNDANVEVLAATLVPAGTTLVNISSAFNRTGIVSDGAASSGGGFDGDGNSLSASLVGTSVTAGGAYFELGPANTADVISALGQTISLPAGGDASLKLLATAVNGRQPNQTFTVTYTDGTTATFTQSISNWAIPQGFAGESTALSTSYRDTSNGTEQAGLFNIYEYTFLLNPTKTVSSLTLPQDGNVEVLAATLIPAAGTQVNLLTSFNRAGIEVDGTTYSSGGLDGFGYAYSLSQLGTSLNFGGANFSFGLAGANDVVSTAGQTITLPNGRDSALKVLATGVDGSQPNQTFMVTYTDGTTATFTQSISDWAIPQKYFGESTALSSTYRDFSNGTEQAGNFNVYEYTFLLDPTKTVRSITLPNDADVEVLAATLIPASTNRANLSSAFNRTGIVADNTPYAGSGLDGWGYALSSSQVGTTLTTSDATFNLGPAGTSDVVSANGQTITLPSAADSTLKLLATAVNGAQANQTFTVTYTDGTTATFTQSISDWAVPRGFAGESIRSFSTSYRDFASGTKQAGQFNIYEYTFLVDPAKTVKSITLPSDANVHVLAIDGLP